MEQLFNQVTEWQNKTFPNSTALSKATHLYEEVQELMIALNDLQIAGVARDKSDQEDEILNVIVYGKKFQEAQMELADCFILLFGLAQKMGLNFQHLQAIISTKHKINLLRKWGKPDANGVVKHVKN